MSSGRFEPAPPSPGPPLLAWHWAGEPDQRLIVDVDRLRELLDTGEEVELTDAGREALDEE